MKWLEPLLLHQMFIVMGNVRMSGQTNTVYCNTYHSFVSSKNSKCIVVTHLGVVGHWYSHLLIGYEKWLALLKITVATLWWGQLGVLNVTNCKAFIDRDVSVTLFDRTFKPFNLQFTFRWTTSPDVFPTNNRFPNMKTRITKTIGLKSSSLCVCDGMF